MGDHAPPPPPPQLRHCLVLGSECLTCTFRASCCSARLSRAHVPLSGTGRTEGNVLFNDALNTFYLRLYGIRHNMVKNHSERERGNRLLFSISSIHASSHRQDNTYHGLCYTSRGALAGTRNSPMGPPRRIAP